MGKQRQVDLSSRPACLKNINSNNNSRNHIKKKNSKIYLNTALTISKKDVLKTQRKTTKE